MSVLGSTLIVAVAMPRWRDRKCDGGVKAAVGGSGRDVQEVWIREGVAVLGCGGLGGGRVCGWPLKSWAGQWEEGAGERPSGVALKDMLLHLWPIRSGSQGPAILWGPKSGMCGPRLEIEIVLHIPR